MIQLFKVRMPSSVLDSLRETLFSGYIGQGKKVDEFERQLANSIGNRYALTTNSGTSALHLAYALAGVGPGDEVISTPVTCLATNTPIAMSGATIVWADINPHTGNIDPEDVRRLITFRTKAIVAVHWGGYPAPMSELYDIARGAGEIVVIDDAAHAWGAEYDRRHVGDGSKYPDQRTFTEFSFQAIKHLTTIDGGCLTCNLNADYKRGKLLRWYGIDREQKRGDFRCEADVAEAGTKWHMNDVCATIGIEQLKTVNQVLAAHWENARWYRQQFDERGIRSVRPLDYKPGRVSSYWLFTVLADDRDGFISFMNARGVQTSRVHERNDIHSCFARFNVRELPGVDEFVKHEACIPVGWWLSLDDRKRVMDSVEAWDRLSR